MQPVFTSKLKSRVADDPSNLSNYVCLIFLQQKQKTGGRTKVLLETVPVHKLADIFVASFEISFEEQLSMLDSVDVKVRLSKASELVDRHLQVPTWLAFVFDGVAFDFTYLSHLIYLFCLSSRFGWQRRLPKRLRGSYQSLRKNFCCDSRFLYLCFLIFSLIF